MLKLAEIRVAQRQLAARAAPAALPALPADYTSMIPERQMQADRERRRGQLGAQRAAIAQCQADEDQADIVEAEIVED